MIRMIDRQSRTHFAHSLNQHFRLRHDVFVTELGWREANDEQLEIDQYDDDDATYATSLDRQGDVVGCFRLRPTTLPHMLNEYFEALVEGQPLQKPDVLEITRFAVTNDRRRGGETYRELYLGLLEHCLSQGIVGAVAVIRTIRISPLLGIGMKVRPLGLSRPIGTENNSAVYFEISEEVLARVRSHAGVAGTVLEQHDAAFVRAA